MPQHAPRPSCLPPCTKKITLKNSVCVCVPREEGRIMCMYGEIDANMRPGPPLLPAQKITPSVYTCTAVPGTSMRFLLDSVCAAGRGENDEHTYVCMHTPEYLVHFDVMCERKQSLGPHRRPVFFLFRYFKNKKSIFFSSVGRVSC